MSSFDMRQRVWIVSKETTITMPVLLAYIGLFVWSFLAATVLPLSSEVALAALVQTQQQVVVPVLVATGGNYLGACTTYWLGQQASRVVRKQDNGRPEHGYASRLMRRYGQPALVLSWVPVIGDGLVALAGALNIPFGPFSAWVILGKGLRYLVVAWTVLSIA
jgi:membrane protein YqaA with SNARE-associated domain